MNKIDFKQSLKALYRPSAQSFSVVNVPEMTYVKVDGAGNPGNDEYTQACSWLYAISYCLKFESKGKLSKDYVVPPLEGLWWADDMSAFVDNRREEWKWTLMIMQPEWISAAMIEHCEDKTAKKLGVPPDSLRHEALAEGLCVQITHIGPYSDEGPVLKKLHEEFMPKHDYEFNGHHHEIYISDPRRCAPEKMKTVLRQPVQTADRTF